MATYVTLSIDVSDIIGADYDPRRTAAYIEANTPNSVIVVDGDEIRVGGRRELVGSDGTVELTNLVATNSADNPVSFEYRVTLIYSPKGSGKQERLTTSTFPLTASANLAAIDEAWDDITAPPSWRSDFRDEMEALRDEVADVSGIATPDGVVEALVNSSSDTSAALKGRYGTRTLLNIKDYGAVCDGTTNDTLAVRAAVAAVTTLRASGFARPSGILIPHGTTRIEVNGAGAAAGLDGPQDTLVAVMIPSDFTVAGEGPSSVIKMTGVPATAYGNPNHNSAFGTEDSTHDVTFRDFTVIGENGTDATGFTAVDNNDSAAIDIGVTGCHDITVQRVTFRNLYGFSVHDRGENVRVHVKDCTTRYCANGINANASHSHFTGNTILNSEGFECSGGGSLIAYNTIKDALGSGISAGGNFTINNVVPGTVVSFNTIDTVAGAGISVADSFHNGTIIGNTIRKTSKQGIIAASSPGSHLVGDNVIANNTITSAGASGGTAPEKIGIYVSGTSPTLITGNMVTDAGISGYTMGIACYLAGYSGTGPSGSTVRGNRFRGVTWDLSLEGSSVTDIRVGENDVRDAKTQITGGAAVATAVIEYATNHKGIETFEHHLVMSSGTGGFNFGVAVGAAATAASRHSGTDTAGVVSYTTAGGTTGALFTVTFGRAYATTPRVFLEPGDAKGAQAGLYVSAVSTTAFTVSCANAHAAGTLFPFFLVVGVS